MRLDEVVIRRLSQCWAEVGVTGRTMDQQVKLPTFQILYSKN